MDATSAQRVGFFKIGSGRVFDKIPGSGSGSGRVGVSKYTIGYFLVSLLFSGISGIFGYVGYFRVYLGLPWGVPGKLLLVPPHPSPLYKKIRRTVFETFPLSSLRKFQELHNINMIWQPGTLSVFAIGVVHMLRIKDSQRNLLQCFIGDSLPNLLQYYLGGLSGPQICLMWVKVRLAFFLVLLLNIVHPSWLG